MSALAFLHIPEKKGDHMTWIICSCCGKGHQDTPEENVDFHTRGQDKGFGLCVDCYGQPESDFQDIKEAEEQGGEAAVEKLMGWANWTFYQARFTILSDALNEENQVKFEALPIWKKVSLIQDAIKEGMMI